MFQNGLARHVATARGARHCPRAIAAERGLSRGAASISVDAELGCETRPAAWPASLSRHSAKSALRSDRNYDHPIGLSPGADSVGWHLIGG
jgi:hypothetical protein